MASGRQNKLTGATGEFLVSAELCRRGFIATPFAGNVPHFDIIASTEDGVHLSVQVKAATRGTWQFNARAFVEVSMKGEFQEVGAVHPTPVVGLIVVMVALRESSTERDRFYVLLWRELAKIVSACHRRHLDRHGGRRPRAPHSTHVSVPETALSPFAERWDLLTDSERPVSSDQPQ
jgi:hypothetical protein